VKDLQRHQRGLDPKASVERGQPELRCSGPNTKEGPALRGLEDFGLKHALDGVEGDAQLEREPLGEGGERHPRPRAQQEGVAKLVPQASQGVAER
jgi:hypothetical protein